MGSWPQFLHDQSEAMRLLSALQRSIAGLEALMKVRDQLPLEKGWHQVWWPDDVLVPYFNGKPGSYKIAPGYLAMVEEKRAEPTPADAVRERVEKVVDDLAAGRVQKPEGEKLTKAVRDYSARRAMGRPA